MKKITGPTETMLVNSINNQIRLIPFLNFIWTGAVVIYLIKGLEIWFLMAIMVMQFIAMYTIGQKIDKNRLEFLRWCDEERLRRLK